jgi:hypothetical protein
MGGERGEGGEGRHVLLATYFVTKVDAGGCHGELQLVVAMMLVASLCSCRLPHPFTKHVRDLQRMAKSTARPAPAASAVWEPTVEATVVTPNQYVGAIMQLCQVG